MGAADSTSPAQFSALVDQTFGGGDRQLQMFTPPANPDQLPGDLSPEQWHGRGDVSFHGTNVAPEHQPLDQEYMHSGTQRAASAILLNRSNSKNFRELDHYPVEFVPQEDFDPEDHEDEPWRDGRVGELHEHENYDEDPDFTPISQTAPGRITGFRRTGPEIEATDKTANMAHTLAMTESNGGYAEITGSVRDSILSGSGSSLLTSVFPRHMEQTEALRSGNTLAYANVAEDMGSTSYVHRRDSVRSYAEDVVSNSNRPEHVKKFWAEHIARGGEGPHLPFQQVTGYQKSLTGMDEPLYNTVTHQRPQVPVEETPKSKWKKKKD